MARTTHRMKALCPFALDSIEVEITYTFTPGSPAVMYGDNSHPADPDEAEFVSVETWVGTLTPSLQKMLEEWAVEYLASDDGCAAAVDQAEDTIEGDLERAAEMRDEQRRER